MKKLITRFNTSSKFNLFISYSCLFLLLIPVVFFPFIREGKTFIWDTDGVSQHFPILQYYGRILRGLFSGQGFPMFDSQIGLGFDTITTLHYYGLGDPIALLTIFMTSKNAVFVYGLLILLRYYLIGISFIIFCRYWKKDGAGVLLGAFIYTFCGYSLYAGVRHPFFLNPMIYLPILLIGIEEVLRRRKPYLLIIMTFVCSSSNFYFLYMLTVISMIYAGYRYVTSYHSTFTNKIAGFFQTAFRVGGYYLWGIAMGALIFVPVVYSFLNAGRLDSGGQQLIGFLHYSKGYYVRLVQGFLASGISPGYWVQLSFPSVVVIGLVIILCNKRYWKMTIVFGLSILALSVPGFGYMMNGFSYIANRWSFLVVFIVALIFTMTYERLFRLRKIEHGFLIAACAFYGLFAYVFPSKEIVKVEFYILILTVAIIALLQFRGFKEKHVLQEIGVYLLVLLTIGFQGYSYYSPRFRGYADEFLEKEEIEKEYNGGVKALIENRKDDSFYRIETYGDKVRNEALAIGFRDVSGYFSVLDGNVTTSLKQLELLGQRNANRFDNFDNRTILDALSNVKYFITTNKTTAPYGYERIGEEENVYGEYYLFENLFSLPLGYTYDSYMLEEDYEKLNPLEKQNAMLYSLILDRDLDGIRKTDQDMSVGIHRLDYDIIQDDNVVLRENSIKVLQKDATITLEFGSPAKAETYLRLVDFDIKKRQATMTSLKVKGENEVTKYVNVRSPYHNTYFRNEYLINTGYHKEEMSWIRLTFPKKETYLYGAIELYHVDMNTVREQLKRMSDSTLKNVKMGKNNIKGDISLEKSAIMCLSVPYSSGWKAYVDGERVEVLKGNITYLALPLTAGNHNIVLGYRTPYLTIGGVITTISVIMFAGMILWNRKVKTTKQEKR